jgi:hypothetical protein
MEASVAFAFRFRRAKQLRGGPPFRFLYFRYLVFRRGAPAARRG